MPPEWTPLEGHLNARGDGWIAHMHFAQDDRGRVELTRLEIEGVDRPLEAEAIRRLPVARYVAWLNGDQKQRTRAREILAGGLELNLVGFPDRPPRLRIAGSNAAPKPEGFYERVAEVYGALRSSGEGGAAKRIAKANGVPLTTVHGWIKEARRRGILPPGRSGSAR